MRNVLIGCFALALFLPFAARAQQITVKSSAYLSDAAICDGVVYCGSDDGQLYAINATDGSAAPGFPVDVAAAVGDGSVPNNRPGIYYGALGKAIYLETTKHGVVKVWPNGTIAWVNKLDAAFGSGFDAARPYVRNGSVYFGSSGPDGATVFKLNATTLNPDNQFGSGSGAGPGVTSVLSLDSLGGGTEVCASPVTADRDAGGTIYAYVSSSNVARVVAINAVSGNVRVLYSTGGQGWQGLVVNSRGVLVYGVDKTLKLISVDGGGTSYPLPGYPSRPVYDPITSRFFVTTAPDATGASYLLGFDSP